MEEKYKAYTMQGLPAFADLQVADATCYMSLLNHFVEKAAQQILHYTVKEQEQARRLIAQFYEESERQMQTHLLLLQGLPPILQPGGSSPLAPPTHKEEERHE